MYIADTNVLIDYVNRRLIPEEIAKLNILFSSNQLVVSIVSRIEIKVGIENESNPKALLDLLSKSDVIDIWPEIETETIRIRRAYKLKLPDAIIAATAIFLDATLVTNDKSIYSRVPGLAIWVPERR